MIGVVSLDELADGSPDAIAALRDALHGDGVVALDAAGRFGGGSTTELFEQARRFFLLPLAERRAVGLSSSTNLRGFVGVGQETTNGVVDLKESFEFARELSPPAVRRADSSTANRVCSRASSATATPATTGTMRRVSTPTPTTGL